MRNAEAKPCRKNAEHRAMVTDVEAEEVRTTTCTFCGTTVRYLADLRTLMKKGGKSAKPRTA
jgi:hypothetical protein